MNQQMNSIANIGPDRLIRKLDARLQNAACESRECLLSGIGMDRGNRARMAGIQGLQKIERLASANLAQDDAIRPVPKRRPKQVADRHGRKIGLFPPCLESYQVGLGDSDFGCILNQDDCGPDRR